ncbi:MAG: TonB family protein, partial [Acidobacteriaceae bacterium]|nr:TonB family protein [Acidobacteriaceae bacterium]
SRWTPERRRVVLLHELAHVQRGDLLTHFIARLAWSFYWWNPLACTAWQALLNEREHATDDLVLNAGTRASEYAGHLLEIARGMQSNALAESAALAMARRSCLEGRLAAILDPRVNRQPLGRFSAVLAGLLALAVAVPIAALRAQEPARRAIPADLDATIQTATGEKNYQALDSIAATAVAQHKYDIARKLLTVSLTIRGTVSGTSSVDYGAGLLHLGDLARSSGQSKEADDFYTRAIAVLGNDPQAAAAYVHLATSAIANKNLDLAMQNLERARTTDPEHPSAALMWMAVVREKQENFGEAETLFRQAISLATPNSAQAATVMELFARFLKDQARSDEAQPLLDMAASIRKSTISERFKDSRPHAVASKIGGGVSAPSVISKIEPEYTDEARAAKYQGTVVLAVSIGSDGSIYEANVIRSLGLGLDEKAVDAVTQWKFKPATKDGQPVNVRATIEVNFRLL